MTILRVEHADPAGGPIAFEQMKKNRDLASPWDDDVAATHVLKFGDFALIPVGVALRFVDMAEIEHRKRMATAFSELATRGFRGLK